MVDEPWVIAKRLNLAKKLRFILYGARHVKIGRHRQDTWAWLVREFTRLRDFRYSGLLYEARRFTSTVGVVDPCLDETKDIQEALDLDLLKAFQRYLYRRREELETWKNRETQKSPEGQAEIAESEAKSLMILGLCPSCGADLPCDLCGLKAVTLDGRGGITPV
jgi:hypothetical protein